MKRIVLVLLLGILLPAILLAGLALRSLRDQELVVESQRTRLLQAECDAIADRINLFLNDLRGFHNQLVDEIVSVAGAEAERDFDALVRARWSQAAAAAVVRDGATILSPRPESGSRAEAFLRNHADFLTNRRVVEIYQAPRLLGGQIEAEGAPASPAPASAPAMENASSRSGRGAVAVPPQAQQWKVAAPSARKTPPPPPSAFAISEETLGLEAPRLRNVMPLQQRAEDEAAFDEVSPSLAAAGTPSALLPETVLNNQITAEGNEGAVSRLLDGELHVLLWKRHPTDAGLTFWTELDLSAVRSDLAGFFASAPDAALAREASFALLDTGGGLVAQTAPGFLAEWSAPFVASEIGPLLPRWEVAAYLLDPGSLNAAARKLRFTLWIVILALLGAVAGGSRLVLRSVGDEMRLAARKTDFVGNVSHELKTPLTSIRMFSELLSGTDSPDPGKTRHYAEIIARESARLARLINRLLDFSKLDRGELRLERDPLDLAALSAEAVGDMREQLEAAGLKIETALPEGAGPTVLGDRDALAQIVLNLLGNAVKYASSGGSVRVSVGGDDGLATLSVADRGPGVPRRHRRRIFERFYRIDDSIASGIDGSGIGLALSRQIAERHGGAIRHEPREGGGSVFVVTLPLAP